MASPWMLSSLVMLPELVSIGAMGVLLLAGIKEMRQGHIGRVGIVMNVFLLWQILLPHWSSLSSLFQWYGNIGTVFAVIAGPSYLAKKSLPTGFYKMAFLLYSSLSLLVGVIIIL